MLRGKYFALSLLPFAFYCSYTMCRAPVVPLLARQLGAGPELVGLIVAASTLTGMVLKLPAGALSDVLGRRTLLLAGGVVFAVLPFAYLPVAGLGWLIAIRFVHGSATAIFSPVASATVSDLAPENRRGAWMGTFAAVQGAGQAAGAMLAGYLIGNGDFTRAFLVSGIIGVLAFSVLYGVRLDASRPPRASWRPHFVDGIREVLADPRLVLTSVAQAGQFVINGSLNAFVPLFAHETLGLRAANIGLVFGVQTVSTLVARPALGALSDRRDRRLMVAAGLVTCGLSLAAISLAGSLPSLLTAASVYGIGAAMTTSSASAYITDISRQARYGAAHGVFGTIYDIGDASGPILAGFLAAGLGYRPMFRTIAAGELMLAFVFAVASRRWNNRQA
jgi:DHA1 family multidrug resistance protein-like MFS transporter